MHGQLVCRSFVNDAHTALRQAGRRSGGTVRREQCRSSSSTAVMSTNVCCAVSNWYRFGQGTVRLLPVRQVVLAEAAVSLLGPPRARKLPTSEAGRVHAARAAARPLEIASLCPAVADPARFLIQVAAAAGGAAAGAERCRRTHDGLNTAGMKGRVVKGGSKQGSAAAPPSAPSSLCTCSVRPGNRVGACNLTLQVVAALRKGGLFSCWFVHPRGGILCVTKHEAVCFSRQSTENGRLGSWVLIYA